MSIFHIGVIKNHLDSSFKDLIDMTDCENKQESERRNIFLSRALGAYCIKLLADIDYDEAGRTVTDGYGDNGIDAIYYNRSDKTLYLVQSKWSDDGSGSVELGDFQKFLQGVRDLLVPRWNRFNQKIQQQKLEIEGALTDASTRFMLILTYSGQSPLSRDIHEVLSAFLDEMNDASNFMSFKSLRQSDIYHAIASGTQGGQ